jgi:hypothetical protein
MVDRRLIAVDVAIKVATVGLLVWAVLSPDLPQFSGKAFTGRAVAYPIALLVLPVAWWVFGRRRGLPFPVAADILLGLPFLIDVVGNALDLYDSVEWWDDANHLVNWGVHTAGIGLLLRWGPWGSWTRAALAFGCLRSTWRSCRTRRRLRRPTRTRSATWRWGLSVAPWRRSWSGGCRPGSTLSG